jgi:hypothetical protein
MIAPDRPPENQPDNELEQRARRLYRLAAQRLDPHTAGRLRAARREALRVAEASKSRVARWLLPTGALAVIALASVIVWQPLQQNRAPLSTQVNANSAADLDSELPPDADQTDPNLYQNLDFYGWLAANNSKSAMH